MTLTDFLQKIESNTAAQPIKDWVSKGDNLKLLKIVGMDTFKRICETLSSGVSLVSVIEEKMKQLSWEERLAILKDGIKSIDECMNIRKAEVAIGISLLDLSASVLPILLMALV